MIPDLSEKQSRFYFGANSFLNISDGAVRSGKTWCCLWRFVVHTQVAPPGDMMMLGRTRETVERNAISVLEQQLGRKRVRYNRGLGILQLGHRKIYVVGVNDAQAESKIRGSTLAGSYTNEMTILQEDAFDQLVDRHSVAGAKIFGDTNPDSPYHWLNVKYLENEDLAPEDLFRTRFSLDDNPYLPPEYAARLRRVHTGLWRKRMVDGLWVIAEGSIYDEFDPEEHVESDTPKHFERVHIGVDYGTANPTVFLAVGLKEGVFHVFAEEVYDPKEAGTQRTDAKHSWAFRGFVRRLSQRPASVEVDPSAASFRRQLEEDGIGTEEADNAVLDGIRMVAALLGEGKLKIHASCRRLTEEMATYSWDLTAQRKGEDKPLKRNDHAVDALRYALMGALGSVPVDEYATASDEDFEERAFGYDPRAAGFDFEDEW